MCLLQNEHDLEQRRAAEIAFRLQSLHQRCEGEILMIEGRKRSLSRAREQLCKR